MIDSQPPARSEAELTIPPVSDPKSIVREGYDLASHAYRGDVFDLERSGYAYWLGQFVPQLQPSARVLDLGCGNGVPVSLELARSFDVTGVDLSRVQIERARALVPAARFVCADMSTVSFADSEFDAIVAFFSIINLPVDEHAALIGRIARWLAPGGRVLMTVGRYPGTKIELDFRGVPGAAMYWSHAGVETYRAWFEQSGLVIEREGVEPRNGNPGFAMLIARKAG